MDNMKLTLSYRNENDKAFGLAGMILSLGSLDALDTIVRVSLDSSGPMVTFNNQYYYAMSPKLSPKVAWENLKRNFYITSAMVMGNVMARSMVRDNAAVPDAVLDDILAEMQNEGCDSVQLENDEVKQLYDHILMRMRRLFGNPRMHPVVRELSGVLELRRSLTADEVIEEINRL